MDEANWITGGITAISALIILYLPSRAGLAPVAEGGETRTVSELEYKMARQMEHMNFTMVAAGRALLLSLFFVAPIAGWGRSIFSEAASGFSFRVYFLAVPLIIGPASAVARTAFKEMSHFSSTSDIAWANKQVTRANRSILLTAMIAAVAYGFLVALSMLLTGMRFWWFLLALVVVAVGSLMAMIGFSD